MDQLPPAKNVLVLRLPRALLLWTDFTWTEIRLNHVVAHVKLVPIIIHVKRVTLVKLLAKISDFPHYVLR